MSHWIITLTGIGYAIVAFDQFRKGAMGTGLMFFGYALANVGIFLQAK